MLKSILYSTVARKVFNQVKKIPGIGPMLVDFANSQSLNYIENTKKKLEAVSPSLCSAKWLQSTIHLGIGQTHSCHHPIRHFIDVEDLEANPSALHNTKTKIKAREEMSRGDFPSECSYCWRVEEHGEYSDRFYKSAEIWANTDLKGLTDPEKIHNINPTFLELSFSSECNLRCAYCDPNISSSIRKEIEKFGPYPTTDQFQHLHETNESAKLVSRSPEALVHYFWKWWDDLKTDLQVLRITGGEPLLSQDLFKLLEKFENDQLPKLDFIVNSNLMVGTPLVEKFIHKIKRIQNEKKIKSFQLFTSIDTWGTHAEFLRWGLKIDRFVENIETCLREFPALKLTFLVTYQALSPFNFEKLLEFIIDLRRRFPKSEIKIGVSVLTYPHFLSLDLLDRSFAPYIEKNVDFMKKNRLSRTCPYGFSNFEIQRFERVLHTFQKTESRPELKEDFKLFMKEYEKRKDILFSKTFRDVPDLQKI